MTDPANPAQGDRKALVDSLDDLAGNVRVAWGSDAAAFNGGVDAMLDEVRRYLAAAPAEPPPPAEPLTEEQIREIAKQHTTQGTVDGARLFYQLPFARAIEAAHGIRSAP